MKNLIKNNKIRSVIVKHILIFAGGSLFIIFSPGCPLVLLFGVSCPGCGLTRACLSALKFDFSSAFYYHPLFFAVVPAILYAVHAKFIGKFRLPAKAEKAAYIIFIVVFISVYIYRIFILKSPVLARDFTDSALFRILSNKF